jgi:hypothetical protein
MHIDNVNKRNVLELLAGNSFWAFWLWDSHHALNQILNRSMSKTIDKIVFKGYWKRFWLNFELRKLN